MENVLGKKLEELRIKNKMTLGDIGKLSGINFSQIRKLELGKYKVDDGSIDSTDETGYKIYTTKSLENILEKLAFHYKYPSVDLNKLIHQQ